METTRGPLALRETSASCCSSSEKLRSPSQRHRTRPQRDLHAVPDVDRAPPLDGNGLDLPWCDCGPYRRVSPAQAGVYAASGVGGSPRQVRPDGG